MNTKISEAAVEAAFQAYINHDDTVETSIRAALVAALPHLHPQPAELAEQQGVECGYVIADGTGEKFMAWGQVGPEWTADRSAALWLVRRADAEALAAENEDAWLILPVERCALPPAGWSCTLMAGHAGPCPTLAATGKQQAGEAEWVRDVHDVEQGLIQRPVAPHAANNAPSPTIRMQVGEVQGDANSPLTVYADSYRRMAKMGDGRVLCTDVAYDIEHNMARTLVARQPGAQEPVAFVSSAMLGSLQKVRSHNWMPEVWALPNGTDSAPLYAAPPAQGIDLGQLKVEVQRLRKRTDPVLGEKAMYVRLDEVLALIDGQRDAAPGVGS